MDNAISVFTIQDVASKFGVSRQAVAVWIRSNRLPATKVKSTGRRCSIWLINSKDLEGFVPPRLARNVK
ncbi:MAG: DNA-binding protein [Caulobacteraceae bacterium]|nr:DNA-binding protein [Caulobacteraceae bacterium]